MLTFKASEINSLFGRNIALLERNGHDYIGAAGLMNLGVYHPVCIAGAASVAD